MYVCCVSLCIIKREQCRVSTHPGVEADMTASTAGELWFSASKQPASTYYCVCVVQVSHKQILEMIRASIQCRMRAVSTVSSSNTLRTLLH